ncbi:MAG: DUF2809 domain-containing protein [Peptostreptococcaceae bacterium]|nr:DUF2809 domain-containing protein [Peptostreptococcaceae bacterium]
MRSTRLFYIIGSVILFVTEVLIAKYVKDAWIRPYVGDILVIVLLYFIVRSFYPRSGKLLPFFLFLFATLVEAMQYFDIVSKLGLQDDPIARIVIGTTFDRHDILCYFIGMLMIYLGQYLARFVNHNEYPF